MQIGHLEKDCDMSFLPFELVKMLIMGYKLIKLNVVNDITGENICSYVKRILEFWGEIKKPLNRNL